MRHSFLITIMLLLPTISLIVLADLTPDQKVEARAQIAKAPPRIQTHSVKLRIWLNTPVVITKPTYTIHSVTNWERAVISANSNGSGAVSGFTRVIRFWREVEVSGVKSNRLSFTISQDDVEAVMP